MSVTVKYETIDNSIAGGRAYGTGNLGKSNQATLAVAFHSPINSGEYKEVNAAETFAQYDGENVSYGLKMYRRDFKPDGAAGDIYSSPRDKDETPTGAAGLPATPYSPNVASPGEGNGVTATLVSEKVVGLVPVNARPQENLNPKLEVYQNKGEGNVGTGKVRTFKLGVGSGTNRDNSNP